MSSKGVLRCSEHPGSNMGPWVSKTLPYVTVIVLMSVVKGRDSLSPSKPSFLAIRSSDSPPNPYIDVIGYDVLTAGLHG
jgi:hypothetical protein